MTSTLDRIIEAAKDLAEALTQADVRIVTDSQQFHERSYWLDLRAEAREHFLDEILMGVGLPTCEMTTESIAAVQRIVSTLLAGWDKDFPEPTRQRTKDVERESPYKHHMPKHEWHHWSIVPKESAIASNGPLSGNIHFETITLQAGEQAPEGFWWCLHSVYDARLCAQNEKPRAKGCCSDCGKLFRDCLCGDSTDL